MTFSSPQKCPANPAPGQLWSGKECALFDRHLQTELGIPAGHLMENAGHALASFIRQLVDLAGSRILHVVGPGNNGGDALVAARQLYGISGLQQTIWAPLGLPNHVQTPAFLAANGLQTLDIPVFAGPLPPDLGKTSLILDALFGVGLTRKISGPLAQSLQTLAALPCPSLAVDIASGLQADQGTLCGMVLPATWTLSMIGAKKGCFHGLGPKISGQIYLAEIGISAEYAQKWLDRSRAAH
jgi:ADP-dependent NAD(P)H-hydrate dehydratase / NAD(P)H-hydrate epimerase